jgi:acyl-coenzyme A thioesterase PaaI-like protein
MTSSNIDLSQPPKFLSILGANDVSFDEEEESITINFDIGEELTHSNGAYVQGGFITAMLDTSMAHLLIFKTNGEYNPINFEH